MFKFLAKRREKKLIEKHRINQEKQMQYERENEVPLLLLLKIKEGDPNLIREYIKPNNNNVYRTYFYLNIRCGGYTYEGLKEKSELYLDERIVDGDWNIKRDIWELLKHNYEICEHERMKEKALELFKTE